MQEKEIIERILALCKARSWTTYRLAKESGITYSTLCTMLNKAHAPSLPTLTKICAGFGISLSQFFDIDDQHAVLTKEEAEILCLWNKLSAENQTAVQKYMDYLLSEQA